MTQSNSCLSYSQLLQHHSLPPRIRVNINNKHRTSPASIDQDQQIPNSRDDQQATGMHESHDYSSSYRSLSEYHTDSEDNLLGHRDNDDKDDSDDYRKHSNTTSAMIDDDGSLDEPILLLHPGGPVHHSDIHDPQQEGRIPLTVESSRHRIAHHSPNNTTSHTRDSGSALRHSPASGFSRIPRKPVGYTAQQQQHALNRLEVENAYLLHQNTSLNRDMQHCRNTVLALKQIIAQKEEVIVRMRHEHRQACMKAKFMESVLSEYHGQETGERWRQSGYSEASFDSDPDVVEGDELRPVRGQSGHFEASHRYGSDKDHDDEDLSYSDLDNSEFDSGEDSFEDKESDSNDSVSHESDDDLHDSNPTHGPPTPSVLSDTFRSRGSPASDNRIGSCQEKWQQHDSDQRGKEKEEVGEPVDQRQALRRRPRQSLSSIIPHASSDRLQSTFSGFPLAIPAASTRPSSTKELSNGFAFGEKGNLEDDDEDDNAPLVNISLRDSVNFCPSTGSRSNVEECDGMEDEEETAILVDENSSESTMTPTMTTKDILLEVAFEEEDNAGCLASSLDKNIPAQQPNNIPACLYAKSATLASQYLRYVHAETTVSNHSLNVDANVDANFDTDHGANDITSKRHTESESLTLDSVFPDQDSSSVDQKSGISTTSTTTLPTAGEEGARSRQDDGRGTGVVDAKNTFLQPTLKNFVRSTASDRSFVVAVDPETLSITSMGSSSLRLRPASPSTILSRLWQGVGRQTASLFGRRTNQTVSTKPKHNSNKGHGHLPPAQTASSSSSSGGGGGGSVRITKIGIRRMGSRSRYRALMMTSPVSVKISGGVTAAKTDSTLVHVDDS
ncbi:hypothetical protein BG004_006227, partial [Podila humilis]